MKWIRTPDSSSIARLGYDGKKHVLKIEFKHRGWYDYLGVPESVFEEMCKASSKGRYLTQEIKGQYRYRRM